MNRLERRRYAAELRALAHSSLEVSEVGHLEEGWDCDCTGCQLMRAGVCMQCAALITAQILERGKPGTINVSVCSGACREGVERYLAGRAA
jgi:hypothetical protein